MPLALRACEATYPRLLTVFTDGTEMVFSTDQGREISDTMMAHAQGLAALMHNGMHVRGTTMVN